MGYGASSIFLLSQSKPEKIAPKHNKLVNSRKVRAYHLSLNGSSGGCFSAYAAKSSISPLTCTTFVPANFISILRKHVFHISSTKLKHSIMGNCLNFGLKIAHRLSQWQEKVGLPVWILYKYNYETDANGRISNWNTWSYVNANFASSVCVFRLNRCEHIASPVYGYGSSV